MGSEEWEKARKKQEFFLEYGKQIRMQNFNKHANSKKKDDSHIKEMSKREKALEFASHIPKPKMKPPQPQNQNNEDLSAELRQNDSNLQFSAGDVILDNTHEDNNIGSYRDEGDG